MGRRSLLYRVGTTTLVVDGYTEIQTPRTENGAPYGLFFTLQHKVDGYLPFGDCLFFPKDFLERFEASPSPTRRSLCGPTARCISET